MVCAAEWKIGDFLSFDIRIERRRADVITTAALLFVK
nr:MAG TPA: hypothetical protein [Caudoviricetes sp.]DAU81180.1 MAG TPA: hypothetical protein [Caudoviricetes sp.]